MEYYTVKTISILLIHAAAWMCHKTKYSQRCQIKCIFYYLVYIKVKNRQSLDSSDLYGRSNWEGLWWAVFVKAVNFLCIDMSGMHTSRLTCKVSWELWLMIRAKKSLHMDMVLLFLCKLQEIPEKVFYYIELHVIVK